MSNEINIQVRLRLDSPSDEELHRSICNDLQLFLKSQKNADGSELTGRQRYVIAHGMLSIGLGETTAQILARHIDCENCQFAIEQNANSIVKIIEAEDQIYWYKHG